MQEALVIYGSFLFGHAYIQSQVIELVMLLKLYMARLEHLKRIV